MLLLSNDFNDGQDIPEEFSCDGADIVPHLAWSEAPKATKSFALTLRDPDSNIGTFDHWLVCNIPKGITSIPKAGNAPIGAIEIENDFERKEYGGPCPTVGKHRYYFTIFALDTEKLEFKDRKDFFVQLEKHKIDSAQLMGKFIRKKNIK